ncbi:MAG TPA: xanthine dehydrogenase family protein molybdopterin-binding subunit [Steroidobacteraceae bacterium]|jgi:isoquinoline 1-oxidoreductase beta subunit|nr:xanthine dehydrogenase family protein molybdopterin-binding subunit [Steroidobacteraceae bacterium]
MRKRSRELHGAIDASRRRLLQRSAYFSGGLVLSLALPGLRSASRAATLSSSALNAWVRIGTDDSITILVDRSEMGQGVYTALPTLLAEELEVDPSRVKIVAAPVGEAYVNALNGGQITGTSNSIPEAWEKLRKAGAQARSMLITAAAQRWHVAPSSCRASDGRITSASGKSARYGELAEAAAKVPLPKEVPLKSPAEFRLIGKPLVRLDTPSKVDGSAQFGLDVKLPGMLYATIALSPELGGTVASVDSTAALAMPGVRRVVPTASTVTVIAEHFWQAKKARDALHIVWAAGPNAQLDNAAIWAQLNAAAAKPGVSALSSDNVAAALKGGHAGEALKRAAKTFAAVYELPLLAHATMEPMNCTAHVRADGCDIYVGTQAQQLAQAAAAEAAGLKANQVNVHTTLLGGGFGRRLDVDFVPAAVAASKAVGAPVKLVWTREDDMSHDLYRPPVRGAVTAGLDEHGKLSAWTLHIVSPSITSRYDPTNKDPFDSVIEYVQNFPYAVANFDLRYTRQEIGIDVGYWRSVSHAPNCFAIESSIDEIAALASKDPLEFRRELLAGKPRHLEVLKVVAERSGWGRAPKGHFQGIAFMEGYTSHIAQVSEVSIESGKLKLHKITCVIDCGQTVNPRIVESQLESGIVYGLSAALWGNVILRSGRVQQRNFNDHRVLRMNELPPLDVHVIRSDAKPGGVGETAVPPVAPSLCNAIFAATGKRLRRLPLAGHGLV